MFSTSLRALIYIVMVLNTSAFFYTLNTFVFSLSNVRMEQLRDQMKCISTQDRSVWSSQTCQNFERYIEAKRVNPREPPVAPQWQIDRTGYLLNKYTDELIAKNNYQIPILGIFVDRNYFWLLNALWGSFQLLMILSLATRIRDCVHASQKLLNVDLSDLMLIRATAILDLQALARPAALIAKALIVVVMAVPVVISGILAADDFYVTDIVKGMSTSEAIASFMSDVSAYPAFSVAAAIIELAAVAGLAWLTYSAYAAVNSMVKCYHELPSFSSTLQPKITFPWQALDTSAN